MAQSPEAAWLGRRACGWLPPLPPLAALSFLVPSDKLALAHGRPQALGLSVAAGGHQLGLGIGKLWLGDWSSQLRAWVRCGRTVMAMGPSSQVLVEWPGAKVWPAWAPFPPPPQAQGPGQGVAGETPLQAMLARWAGGRAAHHSLSAPRAASAPVPFRSLRAAGVVSPCRPCLPQVGTAVCPGIPSLQPCPGQACGPVRPAVEKISVLPASSCPGPGRASEERAKGWPAVGSSGPGRWVVGTKGLANAQLLALGSTALGVR